MIFIVQPDAGHTPTEFELTLPTPLYLHGRWKCHIESVCIEYNNTSLSARNIPSPVFIECDFVQATMVNDQMRQILGLFSLEPSKEKGYKSVSVFFPLKRSFIVTKDYISRIRLSLYDPRFSELPRDFIRGDIVIEIVFDKYV